MYVHMYTYIHIYICIHVIVPCSILHYVVVCYTIFVKYYVINKPGDPQLRFIHIPNCLEYSIPDVN